MTLSPDQQAEIDALRQASAPTRRATVPALEAMLYEALPVLDHGFVRVIDYMGDDAAVVQAARVSYGRGTRKVSEDAGLIRYLMRHRHSTPFEMCEIKYHVKLPIFVARQWIRHRTANVNEISARYSILDREFYLPAPEHLAAQSSINRQGRGDVLEGADAARVLDMLRQDAMTTYDHYAEMLNEDATGAPIDPSRAGLARELARMNLTLNTYTQWYWKTDLHNLLHFLSLRADAHAQYEIRVYAEAMLKSVEAWVPATYAAFRDFRLGAVTFSGPMLAVLRRMLAGETVEQPGSGLSKREWAEFVAALGESSGEAAMARSGMTLEQIRAARPLADRARMAATTDDDIARQQIEDGEDPESDLDGFERVPNVKVLRASLHMTQDSLASAIGVPVATVRNWEQSRTGMDPAARALMRVLQREPEAVLRALQKQPQR